MFKNTAVFQREILRIGNYHKGRNVRSGYSRDAKSYKTALIININSQFTAFPVMEKQGFSICKA